MSARQIPIAVLVSGGGTNLQALIDAEQAGALPSGRLALVVSNKPGVYALTRAQNAGIPCAVVPKAELGQEGMERRMEELLGRIDGVGKLRLMLTLQSGARLTLAEDSQKDQDRTQRETVTLNRGSSQEVVVTNRYYPVYQGAVVVCQGADSSAVRLAITETVQALTGLPSDRIQVAKWTS